MPPEVRCPGCGVMVPDLAEQRSRNLYVGAAAGCFAAYADLLGRLLGDASLGEARMLSVDTYMAQHPGVPGRQSSQSVWVHLVGLCLSLEHGFDGIASARAKARLAAPDARFSWLEPPARSGALTVFDILAVPANELPAAVRGWADSVWLAWESHRGAIRDRTRTLLREIE